MSATPADMTADVAPGRKPLRLWPGAALAALIVVLRYLVPRFSPEQAITGMFAGAIGGLLILVWWAFFSRASGWERLGGAALLVAGLFATRPLLHESVATSGQGVLYYMSAIPVLGLALVVWALASRGLSDRGRRLTMVATVLLACGGWTLVRSPGVTGSAGTQFDWRWSPTPEDRLLAQAGDNPVGRAAVVEATEASMEAQWPGFRGPGRDGVVRGVRIETDWSVTPPVELWRQPVGPGWSSFAVLGQRFYTQEQRGDEEVISCYDANTGEPVWMHSNTVRFWEAMAGAGPRATPSVMDGRVYALGATGVLDALDASTGSLLWSRNAASETETAMPGWGFAGSPLVVGDTVLVAIAGRLAAFSTADGTLLWTALDGAESYSSPHWLRIAGVSQVLLMGGDALSSVDPADGALLWQHPWPGFHSLQPALTADGDVLVAVSGNAGGEGTRRLAIEHSAGAWTVAERWTSRGLKPYFNDFVVHQGHAYGFDGSILAAIELESGQRVWKGGRYGNGQLLLLRDQNVLLVLTEKGELVLVSATPDGFDELARTPAIEGKTWNHPVIADDLLLVRNDHEMAAFRLPTVG